MANTGSKIYRTLRLYKDGVRTEHVKPNDARDPNYIPPFTDIVSCFTDAPTPTPAPVPTPTPTPIAPTPIPTPTVAPTPAPVPVPGVVPVAIVPVSKPPVVPTPVGGTNIFLSAPTQNSWALCHKNYIMSTVCSISSTSIALGLDKIVSRRGIAFDGGNLWYAATLDAYRPATRTDDNWYAVKIDKEGYIRNIVLAKSICTNEYLSDGLFTDDSEEDYKRKGDNGVLTDDRGPAEL